MIRRYIFCFIFIFAAFGSIPLSYSQSSQTETDLLSAAQQAFNDGFNDVATKYLQDFLDKFPNSTNLFTAKLLLGQCEFLRGKYNDALGLFQELSEQGKNKDEILFWRGETYLKQNQFENARRDYIAVIKGYPQSVYVPQAYYSLAWSFFQDKNFTKAREVFATLVQRFPNHQLSEDAYLKIAESDYNLLHLKTAIRDFQHLLNRFPHSTHACEANFNIAESYYYLNNFEDAVGYYLKVTNASCEDEIKLAAYSSQAWSFIKLSRFPEAQIALKKGESFCKLKKLSPEELVLARANLAYDQGSYQEALKLFTNFIQDYPQNPHWTQGYLGRANVYYILGQYDQARSDYSRLTDQKDPDIAVKCRLGLGWCEFKEGRLNEAIEAFQQVYDQSTDDETKANALIQIGDVYQQSNRFGQAASIYERVKKDFPNTPMIDYVFYHQAIAFLKLQNLDAAHTNFKELQINFPNSKYLDDIDYYLGVINFEQGHWQKSANLMRHYLHNLTHPSEFTPEANYILALSYLNLNEPEEALDVFQKILRLYPNDTDIAENADIGIAKCQFQIGQDREAVRRFKLIVFKYPQTHTQYEAYLWLAQYYLKNADADSAVEYYNAILSQFPKSPQIDQIHYELGQAYEIQGQADKALEEYKAIPASDVVLTNKTRFAIAGIMAHGLDLEKAIAAYKSIIANSPAYAGEAYIKLGQLYRNAQDYEDELEIYQKALSSKEGVIDRAHIQFNLADTLELMSRTDEAIAQYLKIPDLYPNQRAWVVKALLRVAKIYEEGQDWEAARVTYQKIIQLNTPEAAYAQERLEWIKNNARKRLI